MLCCGRSCIKHQHPTPIRESNRYSLVISMRSKPSRIWGNYNLPVVCHFPHHHALACARPTSHRRHDLAYENHSTMLKTEIYGSNVFFPNPVPKLVCGFLSMCRVLCCVRPYCNSVGQNLLGNLNVLGPCPKALQPTS